jgi:hypothetical protein
MSLVHARAWVDTHQVPGTLVDQLHAEGQEEETSHQAALHGFHIQWAPALSISAVTPGSSDAHSSTAAAVLEVVLTHT